MHLTHTNFKARAVEIACLLNHNSLYSPLFPILTFTACVHHCCIHKHITLIRMLNSSQKFCLLDSGEKFEIKNKTKLKSNTSD